MREKRPPASRSSPAAFIVAGQLKNAQVKPESSVDVDVGVDGGVDDGVDDASVQIIRKKGSKPWVPKNVSSGGGTNFQKVLDYVKEHMKDRVTLMLFFTDGYAPMPNRPVYANKFIWMVYDNPTFQQPFGKLVTVFTER